MPETDQPAGAVQQQQQQVDPSPKQVATTVQTWDDFAAAVGGLEPAEAAKAVLESKRWEKRAKEYGDPNHLEAMKRKAQQFDALEQASKSDLERAQEQISQLQTQAQINERQALVASVALDKGLPASLARRLQGDTKDELEADADELLSQFQQQANEPRAPRVDRSQGSSATAAAASSDPAQQFASIIRGQIGS